MHPAARIFLIALVIVLVCSHLILNIKTDNPAKAVSRNLTPASVHQSIVEGVNDDINTAATVENDLMDRIGDMKMEDRDLGIGSKQSQRIVKKSKPAVEVAVKQTSGDEENSENSDENSEGGERDEETEAEGVERMDEENDCDGNDDDDSPK